MKLEELTRRIRTLDVRPTVDHDRLLAAVNRIRPEAAVPVAKLPEDIRSSLQALRPGVRRLHGAKVSLGWFPGPAITSPCADMFGYMSPPAVRNATRLPFNPVNMARLNDLGNLRALPSDAVRKEA